MSSDASTAPTISKDELAMASSSTASTTTTPSSAISAEPVTTSSSSSSSSSSTSAPLSSDSSDPAAVTEMVTETLTETMDDDDFLATLEAYERGGRSRSISEQYIPPPLQKKLAAAAGTPMPEEAVKSPEEKMQEAWQKSVVEYKDLKASKGRWKPAKKVWEINEEQFDANAHANAGHPNDATILSPPHSPLSFSSVASSSSSSSIPATESSPNAATNDQTHTAASSTAATQETILSPRLRAEVFSPVPEQMEEDSWRSLQLQFGTALIEPNSAISGFASLRSAQVQNAHRLSATSHHALDANTESFLPKASGSSMGVSDLTVDETLTEQELELLSSPVAAVTARISRADQAELLKMYLTDLSAQFYRVSSSGQKLVKHSRYSYPKAKLVKLNWETGILSWGSGEVNMRDVVRMKLHRFSGTSIEPDTPPVTSVAAARVHAAALHAAVTAAPLSPRGSASTPASENSASGAPASAAEPVGSVFSSDVALRDSVNKKVAAAEKKRLKASAPKSLMGLFTAKQPPPDEAQSKELKKAALALAASKPNGHFLFSLFTKARTLQLDAPTEFDRELWLLGLYNFHQTFVLSQKTPFGIDEHINHGFLKHHNNTNNGDSSSSSTPAISPIAKPIECVNFEVLLTGELRVHLQKTDGHTTTATAETNSNNTKSEATNTNEATPSSPAPADGAASSNASASLPSPLKLSSPTLSPRTSPPSSPHGNNGSILSSSNALPWWKSPAPATAVSTDPVPDFLKLVQSDKGASLIKHSSNGKAKRVELSISSAGIVSWKGKETIALSEALSIESGKTTKVLKALKEKIAADSRCFSIIMPKRTLDLEVTWTEQQLKEKKEKEKLEKELLEKTKKENKKNSKKDKKDKSATDGTVATAAASPESPQASPLPEGSSFIAATELTDEEFLTCERDAWVENFRLALGNVKKFESISSTLLSDPTAAIAGNKARGESMDLESNPLAAILNTSTAADSSSAAETNSSASATTSSTTTGSSATAAAPVVGWRKSVKSSQTTMLPTLDIATLESDSSSDEDDSSSDDDENSDSDGEGEEDEEREKAIADKLMREAAQRNGTSTTAEPAATAATDAAASAASEHRPRSFPSDSDSESPSESESDSDSESPTPSLKVHEESNKSQPPAAVTSAHAESKKEKSQSLSSQTSSDSDSDSDEGSDSEKLVVEIDSTIGEEVVAPRSRSHKHLPPVDGMPRRVVTSNRADAYRMVTTGDSSDDDSDSDDEEDDCVNDNEIEWEEWEDLSTAPAATSTSNLPISAPLNMQEVKPRGRRSSQALGEDTTLASLLRMDQLSAVRVPESKSSDDEDSGE